MTHTPNTVERLRALGELEPGEVLHPRSIIDLGKSAADEIERLRAESQEYWEEAEHHANLAFVDRGANPPISWKQRAEAAEVVIEKIRNAQIRNAADAAGLTKNIIAHYDKAREADNG